MDVRPVDRVRVWAGQAQHPQRNELAWAVIDLDARLRLIESQVGRLATVDTVEALRQQMGRVAEAVPHAWVLVDARDPSRPIFIDTFATPEGARRAAETYHGAPVQWPDAVENTAQTGFIHPPSEGDRTVPRYRIERRALR